MDKKLYLHIGIYSIINAKFYNFIEDNFDLEEHEFVFYNYHNPQKVNFKNTKVISVENLYELIKILPLIYRADKIYFHGFFIGKLIIAFYLCPRLLKKCNWIIWGGGLTAYNKPKTTLKAKMYESMRRRVFKDMGAVITHISEDYEKAKKWYGIKAKYKKFFSQPYQAVGNYDLKNRENCDEVKIVIGNSGDEIHNHKEILDFLNKPKYGEIKIICPLSYAGSKEYVEHVIDYGKDMFEDKIEFITDFLSLEDYKNVLKDTDIGIYAIRQQGALGNITLMLSMGKKVYLVPETPNWNYFIGKGFKVFDYSDLSNEDIGLQALSEQEALHNIILSKQLFSMDSILENWKNEFESQY